MQVVQEMFSHSPQKSIRQAARESGLSFPCVCNVLKNELKWRAWKPHYCQALSSEDDDIHMEFGEMMLAWFRDWSDLLKNILWSDKAVFHTGGFVTVITATIGREKILVLPVKKCRIDPR